MSGTSVGFSIFLIWSMDSSSGESPPCMQRMRSSMSAATGRQLKQSMNSFHSLMLYLRLPTSPQDYTRRKSRRCGLSMSIRGSPAAGRSFAGTSPCTPSAGIWSIAKISPGPRSPPGKDSWNREGTCRGRTIAAGRGTVRGCLLSGGRHTADFERRF